MSASEAQQAVPTRVRYAVWFGPQWSDIRDCHVESEDPAAFVLDPSGDYFQLYDRLVLEWGLDGETVTLRSEPFNHSPIYVPGGRILTGEEREAAFASGGALECIGTPEDCIAIRTRYRTAGLWKPTVVVVLPSQASA